MARRNASIPDASAVNAQWLIQLRWAQIVGQAATVLGADVLLGVDLPLYLLWAVVAVGLGSNLALAASVRRRGRADGRVLAAVMALDIAALTGLLYLTGGADNPFGFLYLVQIALATVILEAAWTWALVALSFLGFGLLLLLDHRPLTVSPHTRAIGVWVALGVASAFIVHFLLRVTHALAARDAELAEAHNLAARQERLASLATMAAGAAHELATPLGTVALVAKELERHLAGHEDRTLAEDARLIREQVGRCRAILDQMAGGTGAAGEGLVSQPVAEVLAEAMTIVRPEPSIRTSVTPEVAATVVNLPVRAVTQALRSLITNAQDASPAGSEVLVSATCRAGVLAIDVVDRGRGMSAEVLARIGEPFYTTKQPGRGMGLGLFLARAVFESIGGAMAIDSREGAGTRVTVTMPTDAAARAQRGRGTPRATNAPAGGI
ncbi:MAG: HAMP domain-containing histidine kinase [Myxococcales bacterium]|nr:HAMP domain-containing histidine kinase [Myxococcales bacterium]MBK7198086.1 HAMP domain-containing histidine kinase [Myxococcales bacterium]MBP6845305.1 HAMP domain-containing histidine kinase [Kofleriaceae bacterium]